MTEDGGCTDSCWCTARGDEPMTEDTLNDTARLTEEERAERRCNCDFCYWDEHYTRAAVEAIIAARTAALARDRDALAAKVARVEALAEVVRRLQKPDPDTGDRDVSFFALVDALDPDDAALAGPEDTARDTQRDDEGSGL